MPKIPKKGYISNQGLVDIDNGVKDSLNSSSFSLYIGIDPGQAGGMSVIYPNSVVEIEPMGQTELQIWKWFQSLPPTGYAVIEKVHSMPDQGVASSFRFGMGYGELRMALIAAGIPFEEVDPRAWQKALGIPPKKKTESKAQWKNRLLALAQQLFPQIPLWAEKRAKGRMLAVADALLIAEYCRRKHEGRL